MIKTGKLAFHNCKPQYRALVIKILWHSDKDRRIDQYNRNESGEINPCVYVQLILTRVPRQFNGEMIVISTNSEGTIGQPHTNNDVRSLPHTTYQN